MLTLMVAAFLSAEPPSPPPLVPAVPEDPQRAPLLPPPPPPPSEPASPRYAPEPDDADVARTPTNPGAGGFSIGRGATVAGVAAGTGALLVGGALWFLISVRDPASPLLLLAS